MTAKEFLQKRWWLVLLVVLFIIGKNAGDKTDGSSSSSSIWSKKNNSNRQVTCFQCGARVNYADALNMRKPTDPSQPDYSDYKFCSAQCGKNFAWARNIVITNR